MILVFGMNSDDWSWRNGRRRRRMRWTGSFPIFGFASRGGTDTYLTTLGALHDSTQDSMFVWAQCLKSERPTVVNSLGRRGGHAAVRRLRQWFLTGSGLTQLARKAKRSSVWYRASRSPRIRTLFTILCFLLGFIKHILVGGVWRGIPVSTS